MHNVRRAIQLSTQAGDELGFMGKLTTPGGVSAALDLRRERSARTDELIGADLSFRLCRPLLSLASWANVRLGASEPVFLLFARSDYPVPLYPGFVMRNIGIGLVSTRCSKSSPTPSQTTGQSDRQWPNRLARSGIARILDYTARGALI